MNKLYSAILNTLHAVMSTNDARDWGGTVTVSQSQAIGLCSHLQSQWPCCFREMKWGYIMPIRFPQSKRNCSRSNQNLIRSTNIFSYIEQKRAKQYLNHYTSSLQKSNIEGARSQVSTLKNVPKETLSFPFLILSLQN